MQGKAAPSLLSEVEALVGTLGASLVVLPAEGNLRGAARLAGLAPQSGISSEPPQVLFLAGAALPADSAPYVIYHSIYPPAQSFLQGLLLPAAAFSES